MNTAKTFFDTIILHQETGPGINDISFDVDQIIKTSQINNGSAHITAIGSTGSVSSIEDEPGVIEDRKDAVNRIAAADAP